VPLQKQNVNFPLAQGLNTKVDPKQQPPGTFKVLQNVKFTTMGEFRKRNGYSSITLSDVDGAAVSNSIGLSSFKSQLLTLTKTRVFSYAENGGVWNNEGPYSILDVESQVIKQSNVQQTELQCAFLNNLKVFAWCEVINGNNRVKVSVIDQTDRTFIVNSLEIPDQSNTDSTQNISSLRLIEFSNRMWIFYVVDGGTDADKLMVRRFDLLGYVGGEVLFANSFNAEGDINIFGSIGLLDNTKYIYDVAAGTEKLSIGLYDDSSDLIYLPIKRDSTLGGSVAYTGEQPSVAIDMITDPTGRIITAFIDNSTNVKLQVHDENLSLLTPITTPDLYTLSDISTPTFTGKNICVGSIDSDTYTVFVHGLGNGVDLYNTSTDAASFDSTTASYKYNWTLNSVISFSYNMTTPSTPSALTNVLKGVGIASKAFTDGISQYFNAVWDSSFQNTYFTVRADGTIHAKISDGIGGGLLNTTRYKAGSSTGYLTATYNVPSLSNVAAIDSNNFIFVSKIQGKIVNNNTKFYTLSGMNSSILSFDSQVGNQSVSIADNLHLAGGALRMYDGAKAVEHGFTTFPPVTYHASSVNASVVSRPGVDGVFPKPATIAGSNVWNYRAIYTWTDAQGNIHRSGLAALTQITVVREATVIWDDAETYSTGTKVMATNADGLIRDFEAAQYTIADQEPFADDGTYWTLLPDGYASIMLAVPTLQLTDKSDVKLEIYRTKVNASIYYKVTTLDASAANNPLVSNDKSYQWMLVSDALTDTAIATNELLYTMGNEVENIAAPSNSIVESFKNRVFIAGLENRLEMRYSKIIQLLSPVSFNDTGDYQIFVSEVGGDITALKAMDDKLIIFKEHAIFYLAGDGPTNTGEFNNFIEPTLISSDVGCVRKNSPVFTPLGIFFKSSKGIFLLTRSLGLEYKGAPVEDYNSLTIMDSDTVADQDQVRFLTSDGDTIVYNYILDRWCTFDNHRGLASRMVGNTYYYLNTSGSGNLVYKEVNNKFDDNGHPVKINLETGWISFAGIQGYQRIYKMMILGEYKTDHSLTLKIAYDFDEEYVDELTMKFYDITSTDTGVDIESYKYGNPITPGVYGDPGSSTTYTTAIAYGGKNNNQYQVLIQLKKQKCESFKIRIENLQNTDQIGEGLILSNLAFVIGIKAAEYKIKTSRVFGTS